MCRRMLWSGSENSRWRRRFKGEKYDFGAIQSGAACVQTKRGVCNFEDRFIEGFFIGIDAQKRYEA
jgi:hypothetical protein